MNTFDTEYADHTVHGNPVAWPQPKNFLVRPSPKTLIEHSCHHSLTDVPTPLDPSILACYERGIKELAAATLDEVKAEEEMKKLEVELIQAEESLAKNKWSKVNEKIAYTERLKKELNLAKGKQTLASERITANEKRYALVNSIVGDHEKILEIYNRYIKTRAEYYGLIV